MLNMHALPKEEIFIDFNENYRHCFLHLFHIFPSSNTLIILK
jgi:hypothetical protein